MNDLGEAVALRPDLLMLGGGNPAIIPELQAMWRESANELLSEGDAFDKALASYDSPQGDPAFLEAFADLFRREFNAPFTARNIAVVSGTQLGAFCLLNLLAGRTPDGRQRKILVPALPEYVGYADMGIEPDLFVSCPAKITYPNQGDKSTFKYVVDFDEVERKVASEEIGVILTSRPTNPSGNVLSLDEIARLDDVADRVRAWLVVDNAYGGPFPGILEDVSELSNFFWGKRTILAYSLSKIGLPGLRTGMIVAPPEIVERLSAITAIVGLANGSLGQRITAPFFKSGKILTMAREIVQPYYHRRRVEAIEVMRDLLARYGVEARLHKSEGAFFLWLWIPELTSGSKTLYRALKNKGVLAVPGDEFFYGLDETLSKDRDPEFEASRAQMLRISFSAPNLVVEKGFQLIVETIAETLGKGK